MERRVRGNSHARCETGEKVESGAVAPLRPYLSSSWRPADVGQTLRTLFSAFSFQPSNLPQALQFQQLPRLHIPALPVKETGL